MNKLDDVFETSVRILGELVEIPFVSFGEVSAELMQRSADFVTAQFEALGVKTEQVCAPRVDGAGLGNTAVIGHLGAGPGGELDSAKPTILLYAHHDVQPVQAPEKWDTPPFKLTAKETKDGTRLFGRGAADDGAGLVAHLGALRLFKELGEDLPVNVKIFIEGEEEAGSPSFSNFVDKYSSELEADVIIVADAGNWAVGVPAITASLRGVATFDIELAVLAHPVHSGMSSGPIIDANSLLMRLISKIWDEAGEVIVPGLLGAVGNRLPEPDTDLSEERFRADNGLLEGLELAGSGSIAGRICAKPSITVIGFDATPTAKASNVFAASSKARLSLRIAPGQDPKEAADAVISYLEANVPFNAHFKGEIHDLGPAFKADINSPAALKFKEALEEGFGEKVVYAGMGGSIPFTADLNRVFPNADVLISGVEDPDSRAHSDNESVVAQDLKKVIHSEYLLLKKLGDK